MRFGLDYGGFIAPAQHKAIGSTFACRYLRELGAGEVKQLHAAGIDVVLIYERDARRALGGQAQGVADGKEGLAQANALGAPASVPFYYAIDFDETPAQASTVYEYLHGIVSVIGIDRAGAYGGYWTITRLFAEGEIKYGWQTIAWSGTNLPTGSPTGPDPKAQLFQYSNNHHIPGAQLPVDYNHALAVDFGQWAAKANPQPQPQPSPTRPVKPGWQSVKYSFEAQFDEVTGAHRAGPVTVESERLNAPPLGG